jgi:hypothetical protein
MSKNRSYGRCAMRALAMCAAVLAGGTALAAEASGAAVALARYHDERAACSNGDTRQTRAACLREAAAAYAEARSGKLGTGAQVQPGNESQRCSALPGADREACKARMAGAGTTDGTAAEGGIYRELVTTEPAPPRP